MNKIIPDRALSKCNVCGKIKWKIRGHRFPSGCWDFQDDHGKHWNKRVCPSCAREQSLACARRNGQKARSELTDRKNAISFWSEQTAKVHFEQLGYSVVQTSAHGPDLILTKNGETKTCEVKLVCATGAFRSGRGRYYFVTPIYDNRKQDDLIAMVFENGRIIVETMKEHLAKSTVSGRRSLTKEARSMFGEMPPKWSHRVNRQPNDFQLAINSGGLNKG